MRTTTTLKAVVIGMALLLGRVAAAQAGDYCVDINNGFSILVLKAFAPPGKGKCNEVRGFADLPAKDYFSNGFACGSTDGSHVSFVLMGTSSAFGGTFRGMNFLRLDLPAATGLGSFCTIDTGLGGICALDIPIVHVPCSPTTMPVE